MVVSRLVQVHLMKPEPSRRPATRGSEQNISWLAASYSSSLRIKRLTTLAITGGHTTTSSLAAEIADRRLRRRHAPESDGDGGDQPLGFDGFGNMHLKSRGERQRPLIVSGVGGKREGGNLRRSFRPELSQFPNQTIAVLVWHSDIADQHIRVPLLKREDGIGRRFGTFDF